MNSVPMLTCLPCPKAYPGGLAWCCHLSKPPESNAPEEAWWDLPSNLHRPGRANKGPLAPAPTRNGRLRWASKQLAQTTQMSGRRGHRFHRATGTSQRRTGGGGFPESPDLAAFHQKYGAATGLTPRASTTKYPVRHHEKHTGERENGAAAPETETATVPLEVATLRSWCGTLHRSVSGAHKQY